MQVRVSAFALAALLLVSSCASSKRTPTEIRATHPQCEHAEEQLKMLDDEMVATHERLLAGVTSFSPTLAVVTLLTGSYKENFAVATGAYEKALKEKMEEIRDTCGLQNLPMKSDGF